ncbi:hypothetical protein ABKN59_003158 [Abortiporus biennis]
MALRPPFSHLSPDSSTAGFFFFLMKPESLGERARLNVRNFHFVETEILSTCPYANPGVRSRARTTRRVWSLGEGSAVRRYLLLTECEDAANSYYCHGFFRLGSFCAEVPHNDVFRVWAELIIRTDQRLPLFAKKIKRIYDNVFVEKGFIALV